MGGQIAIGNAEPKSKPAHYSKGFTGTSRFHTKHKSVFNYSRDVQTESPRVQEMQDFFRTVNPVRPRRQRRSWFSDPRLINCTHVYYRHAKKTHALDTPFRGPFRIISRAPTFFVIDYNGHEARVAIERIKAAYELPIRFFSQKENS